MKYQLGHIRLVLGHSLLYKIEQEDMRSTVLVHAIESVLE
jgi:hypothetical protein